MHQSHPTQKRGQGSRRSSQKGFISALMLFAGMIMAYFAIKIIEIGEVSMRVNNEKQLLDTHGLLVGQSIILNGLDETCRNGQFVGGMAKQSRDLYDQVQENENDRYARKCDTRSHGFDGY